MIKRSLFITLLILISPSAYAAETPVVGIYTDFGNRRGQGTGFCISESGNILTVYHVVYGARRVDVQYGGIQFKDVVIQSVLPEVDLALLKLPTKPPNLSCWPLSKTWSAGLPVFAISYARGIPNQRYDGTVTQDGTLFSEQFRDDKGRKLFVEDEIKLIPLDITIENGISGSPVLTDEGAIGILSGSLAVGRRLSWAIPVSYLDSMQTLGRRASEIIEWPKFGMTKNWTNLRNMFHIDNAVAKLIDDYFSSVDEFAMAIDNIHVRIQSVRAGLYLINEGLEDYESQLDAGLNESELQALETYLDYMGREMLFPHLENMASSFNKLGETESEIGIVSGRIYSEIVEFFNGLPRTENNLKSSREFNQTAEQLLKKYDAISAKAGWLDLIEASKELAQVEVVSSYDKRQLIKVMKDGFAKLDVALVNWLSLDAVLERNKLIKLYRNSGKLIEWLFYRDMDLGDKTYRYISQYGYSIVMPKDWVEWTPTLMDLLPKGSCDPPEPGMDLYFVKTGFFGDNRKYLDVIVTSPQTVSPPLTNHFIQNTGPVLKAQFESQMANFSNFSIERTAFGKNNCILVQGSYGPLDHPFKLHNTWIVGPGRSVWLNCYIRSGNSLDDCKAAAASFKFE